MFFFRHRVKIKNPKSLTQNELEAIAQVICDTDSEEEVGGDGDISEEHEVIEEDKHNSNSEQEISEPEDKDVDDQNSDSEDVPLSVLAASKGGQYVGKDKKTIWYKNPTSKSTKPKTKNIIKILPGPKQCARDITNEMSAFLKIFDDEMIEHIIQCTNLEILKVRQNFGRERDAKDVTKTEILAFIGLLFLSGCKKQNHTHFLELWTKDGTGSEIFRACMSYQRFLFLLANIRFDDKETRNERKKEDKLAAVRFILDKFVDNCERNYSLGECMTIDEMLIAFRGRCSFIQYIPNKPAKYGLKVFVLCDAKTFYVTKIELYCGTQPDGQYNQSNTPTAIVHRLLKEQKGSNRNLTCDNWYSSYPLALELLQDKITFIGTLKKNKRELPIELLPNKDRLVGSSIFGFQKDVTIVSNVRKQNKCVILISTMHDDAAIDPDTNKPEIILDYNITKGGVDTVDKMCNTYSVGRRTRRWPLAFVFQLLNIAGINSQILYNASNPNCSYKYRRLFLKTLSLSLMRPHLSERAAIVTLPIDIKYFLSRYREAQPDTVEEPPRKIRGRCFICGRKKNRVTTITCSTCHELVCKEHSNNVITCHKCKEGESLSE